MNKSLVVITGASSGIGAALAQVFSAAGYPLGLMARNLEAMEKLKLPNVFAQSVDVTNYVALTEAFRALENKFGPIDCLINNAGFSKGGDFVEMPHADHEKMVTLNLQGVINGIELVLPQMRMRKSGTIINVSSVADRNARPQFATYAATKAAVKSLTESLRMANAKYNIRICNVAPAKVLTPLLLTLSDKLDESTTVSAEDLAKTILWIYQQPQGICIRDLVFAPTCYEA